MKRLSHMTRVNLANQLISQRPRIWYLAVGGIETVHGAMGNLQELQKRVDKEHIRGAIIDFRKLEGYDPQQDWVGFLKGLKAYTPHGLPIAWMAHTHGANAAQQLAQAAQKAGALSQFCLNWQAALMTVSLPKTTPDPLPGLSAPADDGDKDDDVFLLD